MSTYLCNFRSYLLLGGDLKLNLAHGTHKVEMTARIYWAVEISNVSTGPFQIQLMLMKCGEMKFKKMDMPEPNLGLLFNLRPRDVQPVSSSLSVREGCCIP